MKFYVLHNPKRNPALTDFLPVQPRNLGQAPHCPSCGEPIGARVWLPPYTARIEFWGKEAGDIAFGPLDELLVSEHFVKSYKEFGLKGLSGFHPVKVVKVVRRSRNAVKTAPPYYCVAIAQSQALIDHEASGLELQEPWTCEYCRSGLIKRTNGVILFEDTWTGEDIFYARGFGGTRITSVRFKDFFVQAGIKNGELIEAEQYSFDFYPWEIK